jgi:hypothetical protein
MKPVKSNTMQIECTRAMSGPYEITINNLSTNEFAKLSTFVENIQTDMEEDGKPFFITATNDRAEVRSLSQNALSAIYYSAISTHFNYTKLEARLRCKIDFGLPALYEQSGLPPEKKGNKAAVRVAKKVMRTLHIIKFKYLGYENKMEVMENLPCTSIMTTAVFCDYMKQIEMYYVDKGLVLESINETLRNNALNGK